MEPLLDPENCRFTMFPIQYPTIWNLYKRQLASFWKAEEVSFTDDYTHFCRLNPDEQHFIKRILAFFASADGLVNWNLSERFLKDVQIMEAKTAYTFQMAMESIHGETYSLMLDNIVRDKKEKQHLFDSIQTIDSIKRMSDWAIKWIHSDMSFHHRVIAFAVIEGVFFSGAFASIFWLKKYKGKDEGNFMNGLIQSNAFIARDEGMHTDFACEIYRLLKYPLPYSEVKAIVTEGVDISKEFMDDALPVRLINMNVEMMNQYIEYVADRLVVSLGYPKIYNVENPFAVMETTGMPTKTNFFEKRPDEYQSSVVFNTSKDDEFRISDDF